MMLTSVICKDGLEFVNRPPSDFKQIDGSTMLRARSTIMIIIHSRQGYQMSEFPIFKLIGHHY